MYFCWRAFDYVLLYCASFCSPPTRFMFESKMRNGMCTDVIASFSILISDWRKCTQSLGHLSFHQKRQLAKRFDVCHHVLVYFYFIYLKTNFFRECRGRLVSVLAIQISVLWLVPNSGRLVCVLAFQVSVWPPTVARLYLSNKYGSGVNQAWWKWQPDSLQNSGNSGMERCWQREVATHYGTIFLLTVHAIGVLVIMSGYSLPFCVQPVIYILLCRVWIVFSWCG